MRKGPHGPVMQADLDSISVEMVRRKGLTAGGWMGWGWRDPKAHPLSWFEGLGDQLRLVEEDGSGQRVCWTLVSL